MHRESIYVCIYGSGDDEQVAHVRAWDDEEAAELFARELELESDRGRVGATEIRVRVLVLGHSELSSAFSGPLESH